MKRTETNGTLRGEFVAMAGPCEIYVDTTDVNLAEKIFSIARDEALRIERKFSRYRQDNIVYQINNSSGRPIQVDEETALLLNYAQEAYHLSEGLFDITCGVLRRVWKFDGSDRIPSAQAIETVMPLVGWEKISWDGASIRLQPGMKIDFGGIGKEYAVDRTAVLVRQFGINSTLINYGGDLHALGPRANGQPWEVGLDDPAATGKRTVGKIALYRGGLATSGDARRYLQKDGIRYSHILNPKTGWPAVNPPRSVSVIADTCLEAGMLASFAMLNGEEAEAFLVAQHVAYRCIR